MRKPSESKSLWCDLLRRSAQTGLRGQPFLTDARYLLALAAPLEMLPKEAPGPLNDVPVCPLTSDWPLERALHWDRAVPSSPPTREGEEAAAETIEVQQDGPGPVRIRVGRMALTGLLDRLAEQVRPRIEWTAQARCLAEERSPIVALEDASLAEALRLVVEPMGLAATLEQGKLRLCGEDELEPEALRARRLDVARRGLSEAVLLFPRHPLRQAVFLELGNLEAWTSHANEALT